MANKAFRVQPVVSVEVRSPTNGPVNVSNMMNNKLIASCDSTLIRFNNEKVKKAKLTDWIDSLSIEFKQSDEEVTMQ